MGGDTPLDHKYELELKGDSLNSMTALAWIETKKDSYGDISPQIAAFVMMEKGLPLSFNLKKEVLHNLFNEIEEIESGISDWTGVIERRIVLKEFAQVVIAYGTTEGVKLPFQKSLLEAIMEGEAAKES